MINLKLFNKLTSKEYDCIIDMLSPRAKKLQEDEVLYDEGEVIDTFAILIEGHLRGEKYQYDGDVDLIQLYLPDDIIALDVVCTPTKLMPMKIVSMREAKVMLFKYAEIQNLLPPEISSKVQDNIIELLANENMKKLHKIDALYKKSLRDRIMVYLRNVEKRAGSNKFHINMNREQFAQYLGVNRSALSHELSQMRSDGIIYCKKGYFELLESDE